MQIRQQTITALSILGCVLLASPGVVAYELPSFEEVYTSEDGHELVAWGRRYLRGFSVAKDQHKARHLFCKSARQGNTDAKYELGRLYAFGLGVPRDWNLATAWYYEAVKDGHQKAQAMLRVLKGEDKPKREATCVPDTDIHILGSLDHRYPASGKIIRLVRSLAPKYRLNPNLVLAIVEAESNFDPKARSPDNARGLMQLIPETAARFGVENVWDPRQNLEGGMAYLRWLLDHFDGDIGLALAGYNAGEGKALKVASAEPISDFANSGDAPVSNDYERKPTSSETQVYFASSRLFLR